MIIEPQQGIRHRLPVLDKLSTKWRLTTHTESCILKTSSLRTKLFSFAVAYTKSCERRFPVSAYPLKTLLRQWARGDLTAEQAIGQILQVIVKLQESMQDVENRLHRCEQASRQGPRAS